MADDELAPASCATALAARTSERAPARRYQGWPVPVSAYCFKLAMKCCQPSAVMS